MKHMCCVLDHTDLGLMREAAECLAETFTGVRLGNGDFIQEPISAALKLSKEVHQAWIMGYLEEVAPQGLTTIAKDEQTGRVVGVFACESYDPDLQVPVYEGDLTPMNEVLRFLEELDGRFRDAYAAKKARPVKADELIHMFMIGVRSEENRKTIAGELLDLVIERGTERGFRAIFGEATNPRSKKLSENYGFYMPQISAGAPLEKIYAEDKTFCAIPSETATTCTLMYLELNPADSLR